MSLEGMDVDQAQSLARQLDGYAQALTHLSAALTGLAGQLSYSWQGPASAAFQQQCMAQYRPALGGAAQALAEMHAHLVANIQQQVRASAADVGLLDRVNDIWDNKVSPWDTPLDLLLEVTGKDYDVHAAENKEYGVLWRQLMKLDHENSFFAYKRSPTLLGFHDNPHVQLAGRILREMHVDTVVKVLSPVGTAIGLINAGRDVQQAVADAQGGHYASAGGDLLDATAEVAKTRGLAGYLIGANIVIWKENFDLASGIDWKEGIPNPFDAGTFRDDYLPTFKSIPGQLADVAKRAFL